MSATRRTFLRSTGLAAAAIGFARTGTLAATADDPWPDLARDAFNKRPLNDGTGVLTLEMPFEDSVEQPDPARGWSAEASARMGRDCLPAILATIR